MNNKSLNLGVLITGIWLAIILLFWLFGGLETSKSLNELRDFLAGIFAPLHSFGGYWDIYSKANN